MTQLLWVMIIVGLIIVELLTTALVAVWAIPGAILGWVALLLGASTMVQFLLASTVSLIGIVLALRHFLKQKNTKAAEVGSMVGETVVVGDTVSKGTNGTAQYRGVVWTAVVEADVTLNTGTHAKVKRVDGNKLIVETVEEDK